MSMFFSRKEKEPEPIIREPEPVVEPEPVKPKEPDYSPMRKTIIGSGITFFGNFETSDPIELNGTIKGDINSDAAITISEGAEYYGNANMNQLTVSGIIEGDIKCSDLSTFTSTAQMTGDLKTAYLVTDKGSNIHGNLSLEKPSAKATAPTQSFGEAETAAPAKSFSEPETSAPAKSFSEDGITAPEKSAQEAKFTDEAPAVYTAPKTQSFSEPAPAEDIPLDEDGNPWNIDDYFRGPDNSEKLEKTDEINTDPSFEDRFAAIEKDAEALMNETDLDIPGTDILE